jgi:hypothetical protein
VKDPTVGQETGLREPVAASSQSDQSGSVVAKSLIELAETLLDQANLHLVSCPIDPDKPGHGSLRFVESAFRVALVEQDQSQTRPDLADPSIDASVPRDFDAFSKGCLCLSEIVQPSCGQA